MKPDKFQLYAMLRYCRAEGSIGQEAFCTRFLDPVFGPADEDGNYSLVIGDDQPRIAFMAHHDTVHNSRSGMKQRLIINGPVVRALGSNCLGADCTTGCWLILHMIKNRVPGLYVIHAGEEIGGVGAEAFLDKQRALLSTVQIALSLDRHSTTSIITHQSGRRTASEEFARDLSLALGGDYVPDSGGTFTDSYIYASDIRECSNLSVGYYSQHTAKEWQNVEHAMLLAKRLVDADWDTVHAYRDETDYEYDAAYGYGVYGGYHSFLDGDYSNNYVFGNSTSNNTKTGNKKTDKMVKMITHNPVRIAGLLERHGYTEEDLSELVYDDYADWRHDMRNTDYRLRDRKTARKALD